MKAKQGAIDQKRTYKCCSVCKNMPAAYAFNVLARTIGFKQDMKRRKMKLSRSFWLCNRCSKYPYEYVVLLSEAASESFKHIYQPGHMAGPGLFDQATV